MLISNANLQNSNTEKYKCTLKYVGFHICTNFLNNLNLKYGCFTRSITHSFCCLKIEQRWAYSEAVIKELEGLEQPKVKHCQSAKTCVYGQISILPTKKPLLAAQTYHTIVTRNKTEQAHAVRSMHAFSLTGQSQLVRWVPITTLHRGRPSQSIGEKRNFPHCAFPLLFPVSTNTDKQDQGKNEVGKQGKGQENGSDFISK